MALTKLEDIAKIREKHPDQKIVFCSGSFDMTHAGHVLFFEDCKKHGEILVVMVGCDDMVKRDKGPERPILNENVRLKMIESLKPVDYCFIDKMVPKDKPEFWYLDVALEKLRPDVYVVNQDAKNIPYREEVSKRSGVKLVVLDRTCPIDFEEISTSKLIKKIKNGGS